MANFPGSVYNPSAVSNGQTIDASRDNGQDAEITAIEQGYLQGSAPLNSSNSTVANLSVSGGCTFAGGVTFAGGSTVTTLNVTSGSTFAARPVTPPPDFVLAYLESSKTSGSSAASTVAWTAHSIATNSSIHSTGTNPERFAPQTTGIYRFTVQLQTALLASTGALAISLRDSSGDPLGTMQYGASSAVQFIQASAYKRFDAIGGYLVALLGIAGQSTMSLSSGSTGSWAAFEKL